MGDFGGAGGIRTLDRALQPYNGLANRRLQPLGHSSMSADMPDARASRKRQIQITPRLFRGAGASRAFLASGPYPVSRISAHLSGLYGLEDTQPAPDRHAGRARRET
jgi:hypothetical protein